MIILNTDDEYFVQSISSLGISGQPIYLKINFKTSMFESGSGGTWDVIVSNFPFYSSSILNEPSLMFVNVTCNSLGPMCEYSVTECISNFDISSLIAHDEFGGSLYINYRKNSYQMFGNSGICNRYGVNNIAAVVDVTLSADRDEQACDFNFDPSKCLCNAGIYGGNPQSYAAISCPQCPIGSSLSSANRMQCVCDSGYYGVGGLAPCSKCQNGFYSASGSSVCLVCYGEDGSCSTTVGSPEYNTLIDAISQSSSAEPTNSKKHPCINFYKQPFCWD